MLKNVRIWFEKKGAAQYISHLDLVRCMTRALRLARVPVWYTEGYNPRVYMAFAMPLSLGVCGKRECMDIRLTEEISNEELVHRLSERLPEDLPILAGTDPVHRLEEVAYAEYQMDLRCSDSLTLGDKIRSLLQRETIFVLKHSKKGDREMDVKPYFRDVDIRSIDRNMLALSVRLPCSTAGSINPSLFVDAMCRYKGEELVPYITRTRLLLADFSDFF